MSMNTFRYAGDTAHIAALVLLLQLVFVQKNAKGVSVRAQELFLLVFLTRYLDLFTSFYSLYNSCAKLFFIAVTSALVYKIQTGMEGYDKARDVFPHIVSLVLPCAGLAGAISLLECFSFGEWNAMESLWIFSIFLESVAIVPQLVLLQKYREVQPTLAKAILCMGLYRILYIFNWVYRAYTEKGYQHHLLVYSCGGLQALLYADFFYSYWLKCRAVATPPTATTEDPRANTNMTYQSVVQNKVCCCDHIAKEEDGEPSVDITIADSNHSEGVRTPIQGSAVVLPPRLIFSRWTVGILLCLLCLGAVVAEGGLGLVIFFLPVYVVGFGVGLKLLPRLAARNPPASIQTRNSGEESDHKPETESNLEEPLLSTDKSATFLEEGEASA